MSATVSRAYKADRPRSNKSGVYKGTSLYYIVTGAEDEDAALSEVRSVASSYYQSMPISEIEVEDKLSSDSYEVRVDYENSDSSLTEDGKKPASSFSFEISAATKHITKSILTVASYPSRAPNYQKTIGFDGERIQGTDIIMPESKFSETVYFSNDQITTNYKKAVEKLVGCMNKNTFRGREPGEVLFLGAQGSRNGTDTDDLWTVTFQFAVSPNQTDIEISDNITIPSKYGWDYLWIRYMPKLDTTAKAIIKKPIAAYIERVYCIADFAKLELDN